MMMVVLVQPILTLVEAYTPCTVYSGQYLPLYSAIPIRVPKSCCQLAILIILVIFTVVISQQLARTLLPFQIYLHL